jgi:uncharacterized protein
VCGATIPSVEPEDPREEPVRQEPPRLAPASEPEPPLPERPIPDVPRDVFDGAEHHLDPKARTLKRLGAAIPLTILAVVTGIPSLVMTVGAGVPLLFLVWVVVYLALVGFIWWWAGAWWRRARWRIDHRGMLIRQGVFWRREVSIPRSRVQHTDVAQGPLDRMLDLARLVIHTAGTHNASVTLAGLRHEDALALRDHLIESGGADGV